MKTTDCSEEVMSMIQAKVTKILSVIEGVELFAMKSIITTVG